MSYSAVNCITNLVETISAMPNMKDRVKIINDEDDLEALFQNLVTYRCGVLYDGLTSVRVPGASGHTGNSVRASFGIIYLTKAPIKGSTGPMEALTVIESIRKKILGTRSPEGHLWALDYEGVLANRAGVSALIQKWSTPGILTA